MRSRQKMWHTWQKTSKVFLITKVFKLEIWNLVKMANFSICLIIYYWVKPKPIFVFYTRGVTHVTCDTRDVTGDTRDNMMEGNTQERWKMSPLMGFRFLFCIGPFSKTGSGLRNLMMCTTHHQILCAKLGHLLLSATEASGNLKVFDFSLTIFQFHLLF